MTCGGHKCGDRKNFFLRDHIATVRSSALPARHRRHRGELEVSPLGGDRGDWASSATPDAFDAFGTSGVVEPISSSDITALDVIGWNAGSPSPPPPTPDLTASDLSLNISPAGTAVSFQINNIGTDTAAASAAGVYLSTDSAITTSDTLLATVSTPSLGAGT